MLETLFRPQLLHAVLVHFPVALAILGVPVVYLCALYASNSRVLVRLAAVIYAVLTLFALLAMFSGTAARRAVPATVDAEVWELIHRHEWMGSHVWMFAAVTTVLLVLSFIQLNWFRVLVIALAMATSLATAIWVAMTGHYGGILVYEHGVGTPYVRVADEAPAEPDPPDVEPIPEEAIDEPEEPAEEPDPDEPELVPVESIDSEAAAEVQFESDVWPILEQHCLTCHGDTRPSSGFRVTSVEAIIEGGDKAAPGVIPGEPDDSPLVQYIRGELQPQMPWGEDPLDPDEVHVIRQWIAAGAEDGEGDIEELVDESEETDEDAPTDERES